MITLTSRAPWLLVNHYRGKGCIPGSRVCFHRAGFIAGQGALAMFGLCTDSQPIGSASAFPPLESQTSWETGVPGLVGPLSLCCGQ